MSVLKQPLVISIGVFLVACVGFLFWLNSASEPIVEPVMTLPSVSVTEEAIVVRVTAKHGLRPATSTPHDPDGPDSYWFYSEPFSIPDDVVIGGFSVSMEGADVSVLHHTSVGLLNREAHTCQEHFAESGGMYELYSASRNTLEPVRLPEPYGIFLQAGDQLITEFMVHPQAAPHGHHQAGDVITPTLVVTMPIVRDRDVPIGFTRLRLDDTPCESPLPHQAFSVPVAEKANDFYRKTTLNNEESSSHTFTSTTTIVVMGGNLWPRKGGQLLEVFRDDDLIAEIRPEADAVTGQWNIPASYESITVPAGSTISIAATYQKPVVRPILDASGMLGIYHTLAP